MSPRVGDEVEVTYLGPSDVERAYGRLGVEMSGDRLVAVVVETDGGAAFIDRAHVISIKGE